MRINPTHASPLGVGVIALALLAGCGSLSPLGNARVLPPGKTVWSSALGVVGTPTKRSDVPVSGSQMEAGFSAGLSRRLEIGARAFGVPGRREWSWGFDTQLKIQLRRAETPNSGVDVALAPRAAFEQLGTGGATWEAVSTYLAVMIGINLTGGNQIVLSPQVGGLFLFDRGTKPVEALQAGATLGFSWRVARCITLMPNITVLYSTLHVDERDDVWFYRVSLLFMLGERNE